jgi:hypothetical protein
MTFVSDIIKKDCFKIKQICIERIDQDKSGCRNANKNSFENLLYMTKYVILSMIC